MARGEQAVQEQPPNSPEAPATRTLGQMIGVPGSNEVFLALVYTCLPLCIGLELLASLGTAAARFCVCALPIRACRWRMWRAKRRPGSDWAAVIRGWAAPWPT